MSMIYPKSPKRTDKVLNFDTYRFLFNQVKRLINIRFDSSKFFVRNDPSGLYITLKSGGGGTSDDPSQWAFGCSLTSETSGTAPDITTTYKVHIEEGDVLIQGRVFATVSAADYTLPSQTSSSDGDYCFPVVKMQLSDTSTATIEIASDYPTMSTTELLVPLMWIEFTKGDDPDKGHWAFKDKGSILHRGNIDQISAMLVSG